jgi:hypothetical protein
MAYKINRDDEFVVEADGPASVKDIGRFRRSLLQKTPEFYELEPAEVIEVYLDEEDLPSLGNTEEPDWSKYGWILARMMYSSENIDSIVEIRPLDTNIKEYPLPGEIIIAVEYFGKLYYSQKLNILNSVNINSHPGLSKWVKDKPIDNYTITDFESDFKIRQLDANEGDIIFNGRFGQSIRFGSNVKEIFPPAGPGVIPDENTGKQNSPNIIIRSGQGEIPGVDNKPVKENINLDGSSIWMTTDQKVDIKLDNSHSTFIWADKGSEGFGGNRITINSDGLILNSKKNNILMSSMGFIGFTANTEIGLEVPDDTGRVYLGDGMANQPVLGGDQTMELFGLLVDYLLEFTNQLAPAMGSIINSPVPIPHIPISCSTLITKLETLKTRMNEPKSKTVHVGHLRGPA